MLAFVGGGDLGTEPGRAFRDHRVPEPDDEDAHLEQPVTHRDGLGGVADDDRADGRRGFQHVEAGLLDSRSGIGHVVAKLRENVAYARKGISETGFDVLESPTAICPIIVGETAKAISMSNKLLDMGVFVIGFGYPVVPEGTARLRAQISAAHEKNHLDKLIDALKILKAES